MFTAQRRLVNQPVHPEFARKDNVQCERTDGAECRCGLISFDTEFHLLWAHTEYLHPLRLSIYLHRSSQDQDNPG